MNKKTNIFVFDPFSGSGMIRGNTTLSLRTLKEWNPLTIERYSRLQKQLIPKGEEVTVPAVGFEFTVSANVGLGPMLNVANTAFTKPSALIVQVVAVPEHAPPLHPVNVEFFAVVAVSVKVVPFEKYPSQSLPQLISEGEEVIVPVPAPFFVTARYVEGSNLAVTVFAASIVTVQVPVPEHAPVHPIKVESIDGFAVKVTVLPIAYLCPIPKVSSQSVPQSITSISEVIVPVPAPDFKTVKVVVRVVLSRVNVASTY